MRSFFYLILLGVVLVTIAFVVRSGSWMRKDPGVPINAAMRRALETPEAAQAVPSNEVEDTFGPMTKTPSGLLYLTTTPGQGPTPQPGAVVTVHFEGQLLDGKPFDSSYAREEPRTFTLGRGDVIKGWEEALLTMRKGEKRTLIVPYWLAYGENAQGRIPPRATLVFKIELLDFR